MDLRVRTHGGALARYYLDALLGLAAIRAHAAERSVRSEHEGLLVEWVQASRRLLRWVVAIEGIQFAAGLGLAGWLLMRHAGETADAAGVLLMAYWALSLPLAGLDLMLAVRQYPRWQSGPICCLRNVQKRPRSLGGSGAFSLNS